MIYFLTKKRMIDWEYKEEEIDGYMAAINKLLSLHDDEFRKLISFSNEG
jgi:hypothetical protein